jgi:hypothetical protein
MGFDRAHLDDQRGGNLLVRHPSGQKEQNLPLPRGEEIECPSRGDGLQTPTGDVFVDDPASEGAVESAAPGVDVPDRSDDLVGFGILQEKPATPASSARKT